MADNFYAKYPVTGGSSGVTSLNSLTGALTLAAGTGITITPSGGDTLTISAPDVGTVTSVAMTVPSFLQVSGSPITSSGTLAVTLVNETANTVFAGPSTGSPAAPTFRSLVIADLPTSIPYANLAALTINRALVSNGSGFVSVATTTATEIGFVNGVTSSIQTQLDGKQSTLTPGSISTSTTGVSIGSGTASTVGPNVTVNVQTASGSQPGLLSAADWTTFNNKQAAGNYITALTGDATASGPGSAALTLATVNGNVGTFGTASATSTFTVNAKGLITAASSTSIQITESQVTNLTTDLADKANITLSNLSATTAINSNLNYAHVAPASTTWTIQTADTAVDGSNRITIKTGAATTGVNSGLLNIQTGAADSGSSTTGNITITSGVTTTSSGTTGNVTMRSGAGSAATGQGNFGSGAPASGSVSGDVSLTSGDTTTVSSGQVTVRSGDLTTGTSGQIVFRTGNASSSGGSSGVVIVRSGTATDTASGTATYGSGTVTTGASGAVTLASGAASSTAGTSGTLTVSTGATTTGTSGALTLSSGVSSAGSSGAITIQTGTATGTRGRISFKDGTEGTSGYVWTSSNTTGQGGWAAPTSSSSFAYRSVTTTDTATTADYTLNLSGASFTQNLYTAVGNSGRILEIVHNGTGLTQVYTIATASSQTISGGGFSATTYVLNTNGERLKIQSNGTNWIILSHETATPWTAYTPTLAGFGTAATVEFFWKRDGDSVRIMGSFTAGTLTAAGPSLTLPGGVSFDPAKIPTAKRGYLGITIANISTTNAQTPVDTRGPWYMYSVSGDNTVVYIGNDVDLDNDATGTFFVQQNATTISNFQNGMGVTITEFTLPISGWNP